MAISRQGIQFFCSKCSTILKETASSDRPLNISEECPAYGCQLSETLQAQPKKQDARKQPHILFRTAYETGACLRLCIGEIHSILALRIAERLGFHVLHGIVDSLWVQKCNATADDYLKLKSAIKRETGFEISFEGVYKWMAFVHSNEGSKLPAANRYFGAFEDGSLKVRGIEARRHDALPLFKKFQLEVLKIMAGGDTMAEVKELMPQVKTRLKVRPALAR